MNSAFVKILTIALLSSWLSIGCAKPTPPITGTYKKADHPPIQEIDLTADHIQASAFKSNPKIDCYFLQTNFCVAIGIDMAQNDHRDHRPDNFGLRLFLVEQTNGRFKVRDRSTGSGSSYILSPTFYRNTGDESWVILAGTGSEYSWGNRVFRFKDNAMTDVGTLNVAFKQAFGKVKTNDQTNTITNEVSIAPYTVISTVNNSLVFSFTQNVEHNPGRDAQKPIAKERIRYIYSNGKLQEVIDPEPTAKFPDGLRPTGGHRVLASKTLQGQFKQLQQGDYLYATVTTKTGNVTFLIDGHESCFLQQTQGQDLTIQYDAIERYAPELSGYRSVNVIRVTTADLPQCNDQAHQQGT
jgi:hypothetical protein